MTIKNKAIFYSVLIFPGSGFFVLGKKHIGYSFVAVSLVFLTFVMIDAIHKANIIANNLVNSVTYHGVIDLGLLLTKFFTLIGSIRELILVTPGIFPEWLSAFCGYGLFVVWSLGIAGLWLVKTNSSNVEN